ncbi:MAG: glycosyltransferase family 4 protein [Cyclobacteriaceae bacterium]|nr:glycosyltransferase family 4 protein [Cyclobacteriaceae bacterium]
MTTKKVLIITYYWPPSGGVAVQRVLKFCKYLRDFGWEPVIYTVSNGEFPEIDNSLISEIPPGMEIVKTRIWEPYSIYKLFTGKKSKAAIHRSTMRTGNKVSMAETISVWIRGNLFIPDTRCFWIRPSISFLNKKLENEKFDAIISTGPPHSNHLIARKLSKKKEIPWLADFRDPWTTMDYYQDMRLTRWADNRHHALELNVLKSASVTVVVGRQMKQEFDQKGARRVEIITNGFDESDFEVSPNVTLDSEFSIVHVGSFLKRRNPEMLWKAIARLKKENHPIVHHLKIKLIGRVEQTILDSIVRNGLTEFLIQIPFVPHNEVGKYLQSAHVLLLPIDNFEGSKWVLTGKLFEYLASRRPVLCIGPTDGDAAKLLAETGVGETFGFEDKQGIIDFLVRHYNTFLSGKREVPDEGKIKNYSRRELTRQLSKLLDEISA